jgi:hypothetical protein
MSCSDSCKLTEASLPVKVPVRKPVTIRESLDDRIERARKNVEALCIVKAKLEALNVLDHPVDLYTEILY